MQNTRPVNDPRLKEAKQKILEIYAEYDIAGGFAVFNAEEMAYAYTLSTSWNAVYDDPRMPLEIRIRAQSAKEGKDTAHQKLEGTAWVFCGLGDFGVQTYKWANDLVQILQRQGLEIEHVPFGGESLGTITEQ